MPYRDPARQQGYDGEYQRTARTGGGQTRVPIPFRLKTAADALVLLEEPVGAVRADGTLATVERASRVALIAGIALRATELRDLAARSDAVESVLTPGFDSR
jgi:hypothetical protein